MHFGVPLTVTAQLGDYPMPWKLRALVYEPWKIVLEQGEDEKMVVKGKTRTSPFPKFGSG